MERYCQLPSEQPPRSRSQRTGWCQIKRCTTEMDVFLELAAAIQLARSVLASTSNTPSSVTTVASPIKLGSVPIVPGNDSIRMMFSGYCFKNSVVGSSRQTRACGQWSAKPRFPGPALDESVSLLNSHDLCSPTSGPASTLHLHQHPAASNALFPPRLNATTTV